jgi:hypothetical protein
VKPIPSLLAFLFLSVRLLAQLEIEVTLPQEQFIPGEAVHAAVRVSNFTGRKITLGQSPNWLRFDIDSTDGRVVNRLSDIPDTGEFTLEPSTRGTLRFDIQPHFEITRQGRYRLTATVQGPDNQEFISRPIHLEVIRGTRLWEREYSVPAGPDQPDARRKYVLQQATHLRALRLYLRVTDADEHSILKVLNLGGVVSFNRPDCRVDRASRLHILHQIDAETYRYHLVDTDGVLLERRHHIITERRPQLRVNESGEVAVFGGERRRNSSDFPVEIRPEPTPEPQDAAPSPTSP